MDSKQISALIGQPAVVPEVKVKYCLYARKSTTDEERQALSIESQVKEMLAIAERDKLEIVDIRRESHSAKESGQRPVFKEILEDIKKQRFNGILTWAPDRLSRNAGDLGSIVDLMDEKLLVEIRTYGQQFRNSPSEKFLLMILCTQAKLENDNKSINVKRGLRTRCEMGLRPGVAPTGYLNEKRTDRPCHAILDPDRASIVKQMFEKVAYEKWSGRKVYNWLKFDLNFRTVAGHKHLSLGNIYVLLQNHFYYGVFEYPKQSGNWYTGKHESIITKELFDAVQTQMRSQFVRAEGKEFAFTKLISCGLCNSGVTPDEKFKKQKNGNVHRYVYYGCNKSRDRNCKGGYLNEVDMIKQLEELISKVDIDEIGIKEKIKTEVERFKKFQSVVLGNKEKIVIKDVDIRDYCRYVLREGEGVEKRELLSNLKSSLKIKDKQIMLEEHAETSPKSR